MARRSATTGEVFRAKPLSGSLRGRWLGGERRARAARGGEHGSRQQATTRDGNCAPRNVQAALERAPSTARGPDDLPLAARKRFAPPGVDFLYAVREQLSGADAEKAIRLERPRCCDNLMVFLPKTPTSESVDGAPQFAPSDACPLRLAIADNGLLAGAVWRGLGPLLAKCMSTERRGCLGG